MRFGFIAGLGIYLLVCTTPLVAQPPTPAINLEDGGIQFPDGSLLMSAHPAYRHLIVVAKEGAEFDSINAAIMSIFAEPGDDPAADNRYLVWVAPGVYEEVVIMAPWVDVKGAGRDLVKISAPSTTTLFGASSTTLSHVTVENVSASGAATAMKNDGVNPILLRQVLLKASGATVATGLWNDDSNPDLEHVTVEVTSAGTSYGIFGEQFSSLTMLGGSVEVTATYAGGVAIGLNNLGTSSAKLNHVRANCIADTTAKCVSNNASTTTIKDSYLAASASGGNLSATVVAVDLDADSRGQIDTSFASANAPNGGEGYAIRATSSSDFYVNYSVLQGSPQTVNEQEWYALSLGGAESRGRVLYSRLHGRIGIPASVTPDLDCYGAVVWDANEKFSGLDSSCQPPP